MLAGKTALITGGCSGIGRFIALSMDRRSQCHDRGRSAGVVARRAEG